MGQAVCIHVMEQVVPILTALPATLPCQPATLPTTTKMSTKLIQAVHAGPSNLTVAAVFTLHAQSLVLPVIIHP